MRSKNKEMQVYLEKGVPSSEFHSQVFAFWCLHQHIQANTDRALNSHTFAGKPDVGKSIQSNIAKCVASLTKNGSKDDSLHTINSLTAILKSPKSTIDQKSVALLSIGEIGRLMGTSQYKNLFETVLGFMSGSGEELKSGAAVALGALSSGEATVYLAKLLPQIKQQVRFFIACAMALCKLNPGRMKTGCQNPFAQLIENFKTVVYTENYMCTD